MCPPGLWWLLFGGMWVRVSGRDLQFPVLQFMWDGGLQVGSLLSGLALPWLRCPHSERAAFDL